MANASMKIFDAARVLYRSGARAQAMEILERLWSAPDEYRDGLEFPVFCALVEAWAEKDLNAALQCLEAVMMGEGRAIGFWMRRRLDEQAALFEFAGFGAYKVGDKARAFEHLSRAASLGRDTASLWRLLAEGFAESSDLELGVRYLRRSLGLFKQPDLNLVSGRDDVMGSFVGTNLVEPREGVETYLSVLLALTRLAKSQKNLRGVREVVVEMIHLFPREMRLPKIRILIEQSIVDASMQYQGMSLTQAKQKSLSAQL